MDLARARKVTVKRVTVQSTTLDDVFLHYTGNALRIQVIPGLEPAARVERGAAPRRARSDARRGEWQRGGRAANAARRFGS